MMRSGGDMFLFLFAINVVLICLILYGVWDDLYDAVIAGFVFFNAMIVMIAETLSIFSCYNFVCSTVACIIIPLILVAFFRTQIKTGYMKLGKIVRNRKWSSIVCGGGSWIIIGIVAVIAIHKALTYPPQNYDSAIYHLPRSFMYWKNASIYNMPFSHRRGLYGGPFSAIVMTQLRIFTEGKDYWLNLIQLPAYLVACLSCGELSELFYRNRSNNKRYYKYVSILLMLTVPMALLQASTTQSDLLLGSFSLIAIYLLIKYLNREEKDFCSWVYLVAAGLSGGITLLIKLNGGVALFVGGSYFIIVLLMQKGWKKTIISSVVVGMSGVIMTLGHWIRNAIDLNGDFLSWGISYNLGSDVQQPFIMKLVLNMGYLFCSDNKRWSDWVIQTCLKVCNKFSFATEFPEIFERFSQGTLFNSHDNYPYGIHMLLAVLIVVIAILISIVGKNKKLLLYSLLNIAAWVIVSTSVPAPKYSLPRYMLGELFMVFPLAALELVTLYNWLAKKSTILTQILNIGVLIFCLYLTNYGLKIQLNDYYMPSSEIRNIKGDHRTYEELRFGSQLRGWMEPCEKFMEIISDKEYDKIGFQEDVSAGVYMMLYELRDSKYQVQYVNAQYGMQHGDTDFIPDCIVCVSAPQAIENVIVYNNIEYEICTEEYNVVADVANTALYVKR